MSLKASGFPIPPFPGFVFEAFVHGNASLVVVFDHVCHSQTEVQAS